MKRWLPFLAFLLCAKAALAAFSIFTTFTAPAAPNAPVNTVVPVINATNLANGSGGAVSVSTGTWTGSPTSYTYQWYTQQPSTIETTGQSLVQTNISGATSASYTPATCTSSPCPLLGVVVTATNLGGTGYSIPVQVVGPVALQQSGVPVNSAVPTVPSQGQGYLVGLQFLTASNGTWSNSPSGYTYQWSDSTSSNCSSPTVISGATQQTYLPQTTDMGDYVCVTVIAYNSQGASSPATSTAGAPIPNSTADPVAGATSPSITGTPQVGQVLTAPGQTTACNNSGSQHYFVYGANFPSVCSVQWQDCSGTCTNISGATSSSYTVQTPDVGDTIQAVITGTNNYGSLNLTTPQTATVTAPSGVPVNTALDTIYSKISGSTCTTTSTWIVGCLLEVTLGTWTNTPQIYNYQWLRNGVAISGANNYDYTLAVADQGSTISLQVIAQNDVGNSATETTAATGTVLETGIPVNSAVPTIAGNPVQGGLLTASTGTWTLSPTSYAYQWNRNGSAISGATNATYTLVSADVGNPITVSVTASNSVGPAASAATSSATANVTNPGGLASGCTASISGTAEASQNLTASLSGTGCTGLTYTYAWSSSGSPVGTSSATYTLTESDVGNTLKVAITPTNGVGTSPPFTSAAYPSTGSVTNPPAPSGGSVTATTNSPLVGQPASWSTSGWSGLGSISYQYEACVGTWTGSSCTGTLTGWPAETYVPGSADVGQNLTYIVIATNLGGSTTAYATASSTVANPAASTNTTAPVIVGTAEVGNDLVSTIGFWSSSQTQFTFQWCSSGIAHTSACATGYGPISGATNQVYALHTTDQGNTIESAVTAVNGAGSVTVNTAPTSAVAAFPYTSGACNGWASSTFYDGCAHAPPSGPYTVQHANFFSGYEQRSGQVFPSTYGCKGNANCHPPWAVAGVDYPVGVSCGSTCGFGTPGGATDPTSGSANYNGGNPAGCAQVTNSTGAWLASWSSVNGGTATFILNNNSYFYLGGKAVVSGFGLSGYNGTYINPPLPPGNNNELYSTNIAATSSFTTASTSFTVNSGSFGTYPTDTWLPGATAANQVNIYDSTTGQQVGTVQSISGSTVTLTASAASNSSGSNDTLVFSQVFTVPMASNPGGFSSGGTIVAYENHIACSTATNSTVDIGPMDFSGAGNPNGQAMSLAIGGTGGPCIIHDSLLYWDTAQTLQSGGDSGNVFTGCTYVELRNDVFMVRDTSGAQTPNFPAMFNEQLYVWNSIGSNTGVGPQILNTPFIAQYNAFAPCPARCYSFGGMIEDRFDYVEGINSYTTTGSAAHGDEIETSFYNGPIGYHTPCYCTGASMISQKFNTFLMSPNTNSTGTAGAIDCVTCGTINVPEGTMYGWTTGDGIIHITSKDDFYGDFPQVRTSIDNATLVTQCKDGSGNVGCNLKQFNSCSIASPCQYTVNIPLAACPTNLTIPGQTCAFTYIYPATFNSAVVSNNTYANNAETGNGSAGYGQAVGFPIGAVGSYIGLFYGDYNNITITNNYVDMCGKGQTPGLGIWNTGFPAAGTCLVPPTPTIQAGTIPSVSLGAGTGGNLFENSDYPNNTPVQGDNVSMQNGGCLLAFGALNGGGFQPNPITDCATVVPP